jgi:hypothetical protein
VAEELTEITDDSVFTFPDEILVELRGRTTDGEFVTHTYQFEPVLGTDKQVEPRGQINSAHEEALREILADAGYTLT